MKAPPLFIIACFTIILSTEAISQNDLFKQPKLKPELPVKTLDDFPNQSQQSKSSTNPPVNNLPQQHRNPHGVFIQPPTADQIIKKSNPSHYTWDQQQQLQEALQEMNNQSGYYHPSPENNFNQLSPIMRMQTELLETLQELEYNSSALSEAKYYSSSRYLNDLPHYIKAKNLIKEMLDGKRPLSIKDAYYLAESAYGNLHLTYDEYNKLIKENTAFIRRWLKENGYNLKDPEAKHLGIQKFMTDTLWVSNSGMDKGLQGEMKKEHAPYNYDYIDYTSTKDRRNYFVTKTFATGTGQCHTLPVTYLILAEVLGVEAYLSYNPEHSFVRYRNNDGTWVNFETTIGRFMLDQFYSESLPIMAEAKRNSILHSSLNKKQVVASVLVDLAVNFIQEHWLHDREFINECMSIASKQFPNKGYINTASHYVNRRLHAATFNNIVQEKGITDLREIENHSEALAAYNDFVNYMKKVTAIGVQQFPEEEYMRLMEYHDQKGRLQKARNIDTKSKKNLFINF